MIKVLIVDDEKIIREGIKKAVDWKKYGMEVIALAGSGIDALNIMDQRCPDIVLLDIVLNDINGLEILQILRSKYPNVYVILISGHDEFDYARRAIELNAFAYLLKPLNVSELTDKLLEIKDDLYKRLDKLKKDKDLNNKLIESLPILRNNFLCQIISYNNIEQRSIFDKADFLNIDLRKERYSAIVLELNSMNNNEEYDKHLIKYAVMEICENSFPSHYYCYSFILDDNVCLLVSGDDIRLELIRESCENIIIEIMNSLCISVAIGIGRVCNELQSIQYSYSEAVQAIEYKVLIGLNKAIDLELICKSSNKPYERNPLKTLFIKKKDKIKCALKAIDYDAINDIVNEIISALYDSLESNIQNYSRDLLLLSNFLTEIVTDFYIDDIDSIFDGSELYTELRRLETLDRIGPYIESFLIKILATLKNKQKDSNSLYVSKAIEYINENIDNDVSLHNVADALYISSNYLSRIFKQETGESFINYVIELKMNKAKTLLEGNTKKIYEIASDLNYKDVDYFSKTFKKVYGITPSEYKDSVS